MTLDDVKIKRVEPFGMRTGALKPSDQPRIVRAELRLLGAVVSGGQTGSDQAGLRAARRLGLATGGWAPRDFMTLDGPAPWLADFGLKPMDGGYRERTWANVRDSDAGCRIATDFASTGERCTLNAITFFKKPSISFHTAHLGADDQRRLVEFLIEHKVHVLNVAGNSEFTSPGIGALAEAFLVEALSEPRA